MRPEDHVAIDHLLATRPQWHRHALCREHPDLPWLDGVLTTSTARRERPTPYIETMRAVCARCPVLVECATDTAATETCHYYTFRAGSTPTERRRETSNELA
jgi:hypothetical protein